LKDQSRFRRAVQAWQQDAVTAQAIETINIFGVGEMRNEQLRKIIRAGAAMLVPIALSAYATGAIAKDHDEGEGDEHRARVIRGVTVTGVNDVRGQRSWNWGPPVFSLGFPTLGVYNPNGSQPLPIDASTPDDAVLSTYVDPLFLIVSRAKPEDVKPEWINVPLRDVPVNVDFNFVIRSKLPPVMQSTPIRPAQVEPGSEPITLGKWLSASGTAKILCKGDSASVHLNMKDLIPRRMYTVWATLGLPKDGHINTFFPIPLGGTPNVFISDEYGNAKFDRVIKFCPFEPDSTPRPLLTINVQYHSAAQNFGGVPEPGFLPGWWQGIMTFNHVVFPINVERVDQ
jgi:hypothetical protein